MKKCLILTIVCLLLGGQIALFASSKPKYLDPNSWAYKNTKIGATCDKCYREFVVTGYQIQHDKEGMCPYCGAKQNLKDASQRYAKSAVILRKRKKGTKD